MRQILKSMTIVPAVLIVLSGMALAQSSGGQSSKQKQDAAPSGQLTTEQIIAALKPKGNVVTAPTRGILAGALKATAVRPVSATVPAVRAHGTGDANQLKTPAGSGFDFSAALEVNFFSGSADLTPAARSSLESLGRALRSAEFSTARFRIEGYTDNVGTPDENRALSQQRAEAVVRYLTIRFNVEPARLEAAGMGQDHPLVETPPQTPEPRNRRVQVVKLGV